MRRIPVLLLSALFAASVVFSTRADPAPVLLAGRVLDVETSRPLAGAHIVLDSGRRMTVTDARGVFSFPDLASGRRELAVRHIGYATARRSARVREGETIRLLIELEPAAVVADTLSYSIPAERAPYTITAGEIREHAWPDAAEAIRHLPGVRVRESGGPGARKTVSLRGARPDHVRVEVDGVPVNDGAGEAVDLGALPANAIRSIEIDPRTRPGAPGGLIRIATVPAPGAALNAIRASVTGQAPRAVAGELSVTRSAPSGTVTAHARFLDSRGDFEYIDESGELRARSNNQRERLSVNASGEHVLPADLTARWAAALDATDAGSPAPLYQPPAPEANLDETSWRAQISFASDAGAPTRPPLRLRLFSAGRHRRYINPEYQTDPSTGQTVRHTPADVEDDDLRAGADLDSRLTLVHSDELSLDALASAELTLERFRSADRAGAGASSRTGGAIHRAAAGVETGLDATARRFGLRWRAEMLIRNDRYRDARDAFAAPWSPGGGDHTGGQLAVRVSPLAGRWSAELSTGSSYAPPSFVNRFLVESVFALGNPELAPERIRELQGGVTVTQPLAAGVTASASARAFARATDDLVVWRRNWRGQYFPDNLARAGARGLEMSLHMRGRSWLRVLAGSFTWQRAVNTTPGSPYRGNRIPFQPDRFASVLLELAPERATTVAVELHACSRRFSRESNLDPYSAAGAALDSYATLDLRLRRELSLASPGPTIALSAAVENVTGVRYELLERMPMPGRTWSLRVAFRHESPAGAR
ncbi:MAG: Vitamin B12 transporter BtuB [Calditrichaeota bacterium]|nr:Vitamin B12 transporter BtuB [Calditrichota bacterium]